MYVWQESYHGVSLASLLKTDSNLPALCAIWVSSKSESLPSLLLYSALCSKIIISDRHLGCCYKQLTETSGFLLVGFFIFKSLYEVAPFVFLSSKEEKFEALSGTTKNCILTMEDRQGIARRSVDFS